MSRYKPYMAYKDSGFRWLGKVPDTWEIAPLWTVFQLVKRTQHPTEPLLSVYRDHGVILKESRDDNKNRASEDLNPYQLVEDGDLVTNKMKTWQGSIAVSELRGIVSPAYFIFRPIRQVHGRFIHYLMRSLPYITGYMSVSKGIRVGQWDLDPEHFRSFPILFPRPEDQKRIVTALDRETTRIDALIEKKTRFIELLKEKRQALITQAVTKGLDPNVKMKDSGVEWIGEVPEHWSTSALKRFWEVTDCKHLTAEFVDSGVPLASIREVQSKFIDLSTAKHTTEEFYNKLIEGDRKPKPGDAIFSRNATVGQLAIVHKDTERFAMGQDVCLLQRQDNTFTPEFLRYLLLSSAIVNQLELCMVGATFRRVNVEQIRNLLVSFCGSEEQKQIVDYLNHHVGKVDSLARLTEGSIKLLKERRSALITAAVTGQIDLREAA